MVIVQMKMAVKRILSWLLTGAGVLLVPKIVYWFYYWYFYLTGLFAQAFPKIASVFSFFNEMLGEMAGAGVGGLLVTGIVYGMAFLTIHASEGLHSSVLGGHFFTAGLLSLWLIARNVFSFWLIWREIGFRNTILSFQGIILLFTVIAQIIYTYIIFEAFDEMGSLKLLFGDKKRVVFIDIPKDVHEHFSAFAYISDIGGLMGNDGKPNSQITNACLNRAFQSGIFARHSDCLMFDSVLVRKDAVRLKDVIQVHQEGGQVFFNPDTPFCELMRIGMNGKNGFLFVTLKDAQKL